jgi:hypothetical protein
MKFDACLALRNGVTGILSFVFGDINECAGEIASWVHDYSICACLDADPRRGF